MSPAVSRRDACRLCGDRRLEPALSLRPTPVADAFLPAGRVAVQEETYPLELVLCAGCGHLQLLHTVDPRLLFGDYLYVSESSPGLVEHFRKAASRLLAEFRPKPGELAVDIGSNDGSLGRFLKEGGLRVLGVDPAREIARRATESGVETLPEFFTSALARRVKAERGTAALVTANNVFAHSDHLADMADGVRELLAPEGAFVFEVAYLVDMVQGLSFDSVYHEHLSYHSVGPLSSFLERHGLELIAVERLASKGGSIRCTAQLRGGPRRAAASVAELIALEDGLGLGSPRAFRDYAALIDARKAELAALLKRLGAGPEQVAGYGASPTVTTLLHHFELGDKVGYLVDDNPRKQGLFSPGHHLPVLSPQALYERRPAFVLVLAWRFAAAIVEKHRAFREAGGRFVLPLPRAEAA